LPPLPDHFETARLILRPLAAEDAPAVFDCYAHDPEAVRFLMFPPHRSLADTEAWIARCAATLPERARNYVLIGRADGDLRGAFELRRPVPYALDCGYVLGRPWWGRGLMSEALAEVTGWAMRQDGIWRIGAVCDCDNLASARVMEKAGMQREGVLRRWLLHPNISAEPRDCFSYARVR
jgi:ribosomal-protein-alanine N-acetyltransferase